MQFKHTVIVALSLNGCAFDDRGYRVLAFIPPLISWQFHLSATLYAALNNAVTWARAAWAVVAGPWVEALAGPGWAEDLGLMWEAAFGRSAYAYG